MLCEKRSRNVAERTTPHPAKKPTQFGNPEPIKRRSRMHSGIDRALQRPSREDRKRTDRALNHSPRQQTLRVPSLQQKETKRAAWFTRLRRLPPCTHRNQPLNQAATLLSLSLCDFSKKQRACQVLDESGRKSEAFLSQTVWMIPPIAVFSLSYRVAAPGRRKNDSPCGEF